MINWKSNWIQAIYSYCRFTLWSIPYMVICMIPMAIAAVIALGAEGALIGYEWIIKEVNDFILVMSGDYSKVSSFYSIVMAGCFLVIYCCATKLALNKVFFKKYKRFRLIPKFEEVSWKLAGLTTIAFAVLGWMTYMAIRFVFFLSPEAHKQIALSITESIAPSPDYEMPMIVLIYNVVSIIVGLTVSLIITKILIEKNSKVDKIEFKPLNLEQLMYISSRFFAWNMLIMIPLFLFVCGGLLNILDCFEGSMSKSLYFFLCFIFMLIMGVTVTKFALGKVFFKKYKHFELIPEINVEKKKVSWAMSIGFIVKSMLLSMAFLSFYLLTLKSNYAFLPKPESLIGMGISLSVLSMIIMLKLCVERNAKVA